MNAFNEFSAEELTEIHNMIKNNDLGKEFYMWLIKALERVEKHKKAIVILTES